MTDSQAEPPGAGDAQHHVTPGPSPAPRWPAWSREAALVVLVLTAVTCLFYYEVVFLGRTFLPLSIEGVMGSGGPYGYDQPFRRDLYRVDNAAPSWAFEPLTRKAGAAYASGHFPLWNDDQALGMPLLADAVSGALSVLHAPLFLNASPVMWDLYYLTRTILAAIATYLFARVVGLAMPARFFLAIGYVFSGFFLLLSPNHYIETYFLLPVILLGTELLLGKRPRLGFVVTALAVGLNLLSGMPEVSLAVLLLCAAYGGYQLLLRLLDAGAGRAWAGRAALLVGAWLTGIALAAPLLVPLFEFVAHSSAVSNRRDAYGLNHLPLADFVSWYMPFVRGFPLWQTMGSFTFAGATVFVFAIYGLFPAGSEVYRRLVPFAGLAAALMLAKAFGVPGINELGRLPGLNVTHFVTWFNPVIGFCLALLASVGVHQLTVARIRPLAAGAAFAMFLALVALGLLANRDAIGQAWGDHVYVAVTIALGFSLAACLIMTGSRLSPTTRGAACCVLLVGELFLLAPRNNYQNRYDRFVEAPYVAWLRQQAELTPFRIFGADGLLFPNLASAFGLQDIRVLNALYVDRYWAYVQEFISPRIKDRYVGLPSADGAETQMIGNPWFDLTGVRYVLTEPASPDAIKLGGISILGDLRANGSQDVQIESVTIDGVTKPALLEAPPGDVTYPVTISPETAMLRFSLALPPEAWAAEASDGVAFRIVVVENGAAERVYRRKLDPQRVAADRGWIDDSVDLSRFAGRDVVLMFVVDPLENADHDTAVWGGLRLTPAVQDAATQYILVYDDEVQIFENEQAMPRAFLVHDVRPVTGIDGALAAMKQEGFDPGQAAVVEGAPESQVAALGPEAGTATITANAAQQVIVDVETAHPALLVLTDTMYPGWNATIDGEVATIYATDLAFRGVFVPEGTHQVVFSYDPASFRQGMAIAGLGVLVLVAVGAGGVRRPSFGTRRARHDVTVSPGL